jgi:hypothetical protein
MRKQREVKPEKKSLFGPLNIKGLGRDSRAQVLLAAYLAYGPDIEHPRRLRDLSSRTGISYNALLQTSTRRRWKEALTATLAASDAPEAGVVSVTAVEEVNRTFSALQMAIGIKKYAQLANSVATTFSKVTQRLVSLWARRIDAVLDEIKDPASIDALQVVQLRLLYTELSGMMDNAARYISPSAQAQLLSAVNFSAGLPPDLPEDVEPGAFTVASLQKLLVEELGLKSMFEDPEATKEKFDAYRSSMPPGGIEGTR